MAATNTDALFAAAAEEALRAEEEEADAARAENAHPFPLAKKEKRKKRIRAGIIATEGD